MYRENPGHPGLNGYKQVIVDKYDVKLDMLEDKNLRSTNNEAIVFDMAGSKPSPYLPAPGLDYNNSPDRLAKQRLPAVALLGATGLIALGGGLLAKFEDGGTIFYNDGRAKTTDKHGEVQEAADAKKVRTILNDFCGVHVPNGKIESSNNPELTKFGGFYRKLGLDEIPGLISIAKGEEAFAGTRLTKHVDIMSHKAATAAGDMETMIWHAHNVYSPQVKGVFGFSGTRLDGIEAWEDKIVSELLIANEFNEDIEKYLVLEGVKNILRGHERHNGSRNGEDEAKLGLGGVWTSVASIKDQRKQNSKTNDLVAY